MLGYYNGLVGILMLLGSVARAEVNESPTIIEAAAATADGGENVMIVEQPENAPNPLGNPLPDVVSENEANSVNNTENMVQTSENNSTNQIQNTNNKLNPNNPQEEAIKLGNDFQNTLVEANGRIYDVQSFPKEDVKVMSNPAQPQTIYSPNVNN